MRICASNSFPVYLISWLIDGAKKMMANIVGFPLLPSFCFVTGRIRFGEYSASGELSGHVNLGAGEMGSWKLVRQPGSSHLIQGLDFRLFSLTLGCHNSLTKRLPFDEDEFDYVRVKFIAK